MAGTRSTEKGFTLVETLVALAILVIGAIAFVPLYVFAVERAEENNRRTVAATLANGEMERLRAMEFAKLGLTDGDPRGDLSRTGSQTINGVTYQIQRNISWISEGADCVEDDGTDPLWDAKYVRITVSTDAPNNKNKRLITETVETIVSRSVFQEPSPGSGIRICAFRGWQEDSERKAPVSGVKVSIVGPKKVWTSTNNKGAALFFLGNNEVGQYDVTAEPPASMIVRPDLKNGFSVKVSRESWTKEAVYVEYPCWLNITLRDLLNEQRVNLSDYQDSYLVIRNDSYNEERRIPVSTAVLQNIGEFWPASNLGESYRLSLRNVPGYHDAEWDYRRPVRSDGTPWEGIFSEPKERVDLTMYLIPVPGTPDYAVDAAGELGWLADNVVQPVPEKVFLEAKDQEGNWLEVVWKTANAQEAITLNANSPVYTAPRMFWEQNLVIEARLNLAARVQVFNGWINLDNGGRLNLFVPDEFAIPGSNINGGTSGINYGEVHFVDGVFSGNPENEEEFILKGAFYYPNGAELPRDVDLLIPWYQLD